jgi:hypothetical protein
MWADAVLGGFQSVARPLPCRSFRAARETARKACGVLAVMLSG